jgi:hypothetical protein
MKTFALFAIDKYRNQHFVTAVSADTLAGAATKLGGTISEDRKVGSANDPYLHFFQEGREAATFAVGNCTDEVLATTATPQMRNSHRDLVGYHRYGRQNCYLGFVIGEVPVIG